VLENSEGKKVKLSLCSHRAPRHEGVLGEWRYSFTHSLTSALDGGEWSAKDNFGSMRENEVGGWRRLHNLYTSTNTITVIKSVVPNVTEDALQTDRFTKPNLT
jgi:hypothetical protein